MNGKGLGTFFLLLMKITNQDYSPGKNFWSAGKNTAGRNNSAVLNKKNSQTDVLIFGKKSGNLLY